MLGQKDSEEGGGGGGRVHKLFIVKFVSRKSEGLSIHNKTDLLG